MLRYKHLETMANVFVLARVALESMEYGEYGETHINWTSNKKFQVKRTRRSLCGNKWDNVSLTARCRSWDKEFDTDLDRKTNI